MPSQQDGRPLQFPTMLAAPATRVSASTDEAHGLSFDFGDADDDTELLMLQKVVQQTMEKKRAQAAKQQTQILEEFKAGIEKRTAALEAVMAKEAKDAGAVAKTTFTKTTQRMADKVAQMEELTKKYQQDMAVLWEQYNEEHASLENTTMQIKMANEKRKQGSKRRIAALAQENEAALSEIRKKAEVVKGRAGKMPQLAKMLQSLV